MYNLSSPTSIFKKGISCEPKRSKDRYFLPSLHAKIVDNDCSSEAQQRYHLLWLSNSIYTRQTRVHRSNQQGRKSDCGIQPGTCQARQVIWQALHNNAGRFFYLLLLLISNSYWIIYFLNSSPAKLHLAR